MCPGHGPGHDFRGLIIKTVGTRIIKLEPSSGFASDFSSATVILVVTLVKMPVSTTHVISSAIMGVGSAKRFSSVKWGTAERIVVAWVVTLPVTALFASIPSGSWQFFFN